MPHFGKNALANFVGQVTNGVLALIFAPLFVNVVGVEQYTLIGFFSVLYSIMIIFDLGISASVARRSAMLVSENYKITSLGTLIRTAEVVMALICITIISIFLAYSNNLSNFFLSGFNEYEKLSHIVIFMGVTISARLMEGVYKGLLLGLQKHVEYNVYFTLQSMVRWIGAICVVSIYETVLSFFIWQTLLSVLTLLFLFFYTYLSNGLNLLNQKFSKSVLYENFKFSMGMLVISGLTIVITNLDKFIVNNVLMPKESGTYYLNVMLASVLLVISGAIATAVYPKFCAFYSTSSKQEFEDLFHISSQIIIVVIGSVWVTFIFFGKTILSLWTLDDVLAAESYTLLKILVTANFLSCLSYIPYQAQLATGWTSITIKLNILAFIILIPYVIFILPKHNAEYIAGYWLLFNLINFSIGSYFIFKKILKGVGLRWLVLNNLIPLSTMFAFVGVIKLTVISFEDWWASFTLLLITTLLAMGFGLATADKLRTQISNYYFRGT